MEAGRTTRGLLHVTVTVLMSINTSGYSVLSTNGIGNLPRQRCPMVKMWIPGLASENRLFVHSSLE